MEKPALLYLCSEEDHKRHLFCMDGKHNKAMRFTIRVCKPHCIAIVSVLSMIFKSKTTYMKKELLIPVLLLFILPAFGQKLPYLKESVFQEGEELSYKLKYGILSAAEGTLKVEKTNLLFNNQPTFHLSAQGKTSGAFNVFYTVNNRYDSYIDKKTFLPYYYTENIHEGKYRRNDKISFDQQKKTITGNKGVFKGTEQTFDLLSAYYFARNLDLSSIKKGDSFKLSYFLQDEVATLGIT